MSIKDNLVGRERELYKKEYQLVREEDNGLGTKITEIARALKTSRVTAQRIAKLHENLRIISCSRSDRVTLNEDE